MLKISKLPQLQRHLVAIAVYGLCAFIWLSAPLFNAPTHMPADVNPAVTTDYYHFHWNYWWIRHALTQGLNAYETNFVFAPFTSSLALHTLAALWYPIWALLEPGCGTVIAMLGVCFAALLLNGYVFWTFLEEQGSPPVLALIGGLLMQGSAVMIDSVRWTMVNLMGWFWIPLVIMLWMRIIRGRTRALVWAALLGVSLWAMILTDLQYAVFLAFVLIPVVLWSIEQSLRNKHGWKLAIRLILSGLAALLIALTLLYLTGTLSAILSFDRSTLATTPADRAPNIIFPEGYFLRLERGISLGSLILPLFVSGIVLFCMGHRRSMYVTEPSRRFLMIPGWVWLATSIAPLLLSTGEAITVAGITIPMPYAGFHELLGGTFRYPERFANVFMIPAMAFALPQIGRWFAIMHHEPKRRIILRAAMILLILLTLWDTRILQSIPIRPIPTEYNFYAEMRDEPYDYVVVEVPTAGASGEGIVGRSDWAATQFYGVTHGKRMINGHLSRVDPWRYLYMETSDPMLAWLGQRRYLDVDLVRSQLEERIFTYPIGYFVIHTRWLPQNGPTLQEILGFLNSQADLVCPMWIEGDAIVYRTRWHPDGCPPRTPVLHNGDYEINIGDPEDQRYIGWGWHWREDVGGTWWRWMGDYPRLGSESVPQGGFFYSDLYLELPAGDYRLKFSAQSFAEPRILSILANEEFVGRVDVQPDQLQEFTLPLSVRANPLHLRFAYDAAPSPVELGLGEDARRLAVAVEFVRFEPSE